MARNLKTDPITQTDIEDYLRENSSDFIFELQVLTKLKELDYECDHSGIYEDPVTKKSREFDIRAYKKFGDYQVCISVECKNIRNNFPLLVYSTERKAHECFHQLLHNPGNFEKSDQAPNVYDHKSHLEEAMNLLKNTEAIQVSHPYSVYRQGDFVAKSWDQVGRYENNAFVQHRDEQITDKMTQAINSAYGWIELVRNENMESIYYMILPILVIPDNMLWELRFKDDGSQMGSVRRIPTMSRYIRRTWTTGRAFPTEYTISHLEIVTLSHLGGLLTRYFDDSRQWKSTFPEEILKSE